MVPFLPYVFFLAGPKRTKKARGRQKNLTRPAMAAGGYKKELALRAQTSFLLNAPAVRRPLFF